VEQNRPSRRRRVGRWLEAMPHPDLVFEIAPERVAAARWGLHRLEASAQESLPPGAVRPSPSQPNLADREAVSGAVTKVAERVRGMHHEAVLLVPDTVVRIFVLGFETFPRKDAEAVPLLRWRLKKSVPFPVEETVLSWTEQPAAGGGMEVVTAVARESVVREYEQALEAGGLHPGVVLGSTLAALPMVEDGPAALLVRLAGASLTTAIVDGGRLALYRCTDLGASLEPQMLLDEIFPAIAYFQESAKRDIERVRLAGLGDRESELSRRLGQELGCSVAPLGGGSAAASHLPDGAGELLSHQLESLVGWHLNRGA
jgi:type IV pilus assembly protein PilM